MMLWDAMALAASPSRHTQRPQPHRGNAGTDDGRGRRGRWPFLPGEGLVLGAERESDVALAHGRHPPPPGPRPASAAMAAAAAAAQAPPRASPGGRGAARRAAAWAG